MGQQRPPKPSHRTASKNLQRFLLAIVLTAIALLQSNSRTQATAQSPTNQSSTDFYNEAHTDVHIGVLTLFHPRQLTISAPAGQALVLQAANQQAILEQSSGPNTATIRLSENSILIEAATQTLRATTLTVTGRKDDPADFLLSVPGKISRHYHGTLEISPEAGSLLAIVTMDRETAVASVVAAESTADAPLELLKAQAIAVRSYLVASRARHHDFDFCDTTHCQFLREPPAPQSRAAQAAAATRNLVLAYNAEPFAAMYTRSCSGHTHTPAELGLPVSTYPYFSVECNYCRMHAARWKSRISTQEAAALRSSDESSRLNVVRRLGWNVVPSNDFIRKEEKETHQVILEGTGQGHGIGLCQSGAKAMAEAGANFRQILGHYYPNTTVVKRTRA
ncbi:MAG TPA: SpoIID/LytB domain-containing protein [Candidatus Sulfotelmatobacter sp.]|nr:SpoIID/LytB domain-containing protein [Candidatus Sulfotelmatobacter sp.]